MTRHVGRGVGWLLCAAALLLVAVTVGRAVLSERQTAAAQTVLRHELGAADAGARDGRHPVARSVSPGHALADLRIPRLGDRWSWVVVEGTTADDLAQGPGHYSGTPLPGARGNAAIAGHRAGHGDPFLEFDLLRPGDAVELTQGDVTWRYAITTSPRIVPATASWVLDPLPGRQLTLTTCWPRYGSSKRMFVRATLTGTER